MLTLNRSALVIKPKHPFFDWLHRADPTSFALSLGELVRDPTIYLIPERDAEEDVAGVLGELCEQIFVAQLTGWFTDSTTWPQDRGIDVFSRWFDYQHH